MAIGDLWVVRSGTRWAVTREGEEGDAASYQTQFRAIAHATLLANEGGTRVLIEGVDGRLPGLTETGTIRRKKNVFGKESQRS